MDAFQSLQPQPSYTGAFVDRLITELATYGSPAPNKGTSEQPNQVRTSSANQQHQTQNPLSRLPASQLASIKPVVLTLHCLFPNDLLLALDILDRRLVQRFVRAEENDAATTSSPGGGQRETETPSTQQHVLKVCSTETESPSDSDDEEPIFLVMSASTAPPPGVHAPTSSHFHYASREREKGYEVRLRAWNCTCPTFALSAFRESWSGPYSGAEHQSDSETPKICYPFGGTLTLASARVSPPVCKHILACVLLARCPGLFRADGDARRVVSAEELAGWCAGWGG